MTDLDHFSVEWAINWRLACDSLVEVGVREEDLADLQPLTHHFNQVTDIIRVLRKDPDT